jgi:hypothetical protein
MKRYLACHDEIFRKHQLIVQELCHGKMAFGQRKRRRTGVAICRLFARMKRFRTAIVALGNRLGEMQSNY